MKVFLVLSLSLIGMLNFSPCSACNVPSNYKPSYPNPCCNIVTVTRCGCVLAKIHENRFRLDLDSLCSGFFDSSIPTNLLQLQYCHFYQDSNGVFIIDRIIEDMKYIGMTCQAAERTQSATGVNSCRELGDGLLGLCEPTPISTSTPSPSPSPTSSPDIPEFALEELEPRGTGLI